MAQRLPRIARQGELIRFILVLFFGFQKD